jgi:hypothetical protein
MPGILPGLLLNWVRRENKVRERGNHGISYITNGHGIANATQNQHGFWDVATVTKECRKSKLQ